MRICGASSNNPVVLNQSSSKAKSKSARFVPSRKNVLSIEFLNTTLETSTYLEMNNNSINSNSSNEFLSTKYKQENN